MTEEQLREDIFEESGLYMSEWECRVEFTEYLLNLFQTYQAQDHERIARALEKEKKLVIGNPHAQENVFDAQNVFWNLALDKALSIVQGTEEEGDK